METRSHPRLALLLSALAHLGILFVLGSQASRPGSDGGAGGVASAAAAGPARPLVVHLLSATPRRAGETIAVPVADAVRAAPKPPIEPAAERIVESPEPAAGKHYFGVGQMTQEPTVASGLIVDSILIVPGITPQTVAVQVWISDEGVVERLALESPMSDEEEQMLRAAFTAVRFNPGKIGRIAVRGHLAMNVMLDYAIRL